MSLLILHPIVVDLPLSGAGGVEFCLASNSARDHQVEGVSMTHCWPDDILHQRNPFKVH